MKKIYLIYCLSLFAFVVGCSNNSENDSSDCGALIIIDKSQYEAIESDQSIFINTPSIEDNCLTVVLGYSGCNDGHEMDLITSGDVAESLPVQVFLKFRDNNPQDCEAFFTQSYSFDLAPLKDALDSEESARLILPQDNSEVLWEINN